MFQGKITRTNGFTSASYRRSNKRRQYLRTRRLSVETLEPRQMLSATSSADLTFHVVNDATANISYDYAADGTPLGTSSLASGNAAPRGAASMIGIDKTWVIDANRNVYVYDASGGLLGSWSAGSMPSNATPEGIATNRNDLWIVDGRSDKVYRYAGAASRLSGSQNAASSFNLASGNANPKDMVTDGASLWVVNDTAKTDRAFKYSITGGLVGYWTIDSANKTPTGITLDPANISDIWISDSATDRVYKYTAAAGRNSGGQAAAVSFALTTGNTNPQGIVVPGRPWAETPYEVEWIRQFGTAADDWTRGVSADAFGNVYVSGGTNGSVSAPYPTGAGTGYLAKYDSAGNVTWFEEVSSGINQDGVRVATDSLGNVFQVLSHASDGSAAGLTSFDTGGALRWRFDLPSAEYIFNVAADDLGYAFLTTYEGNFVRLRKFDGATGSVVWEQHLDTGGYVNVSGVSADHMGHIYIAAYTAGALLGPNAGGYDALVAKFTDGGELLWTRQFGSTGADYAFQIVADQFGNVYTSGQTTGSLGGPNAGERDHFLAKHDAAGNLLWMRQFGTSGDETSSGSWVDAQGNVYRSMTTNGALAGPHLGDYDMAVVKYDPAGNIMWATQLGTSGHEITWGGITGDDQGNLYVAGRTTGSMDGPNAGGADAVLIKLSPPTTAASGGLLDSPDATAALRVSADGLASGTAMGTTSTSTSTPLAALADNKVAGKLSPSKKPDVALAREQALESWMPERNDGPAKQESATATARKSDDVELTGAAALDAALSKMQQHRWPKIVAEIALAIC